MSSDQKNTSDNFDILSLDDEALNELSEDQERLDQLSLDEYWLVYQWRLKNGKGVDQSTKDLWKMSTGEDWDDFDPTTEDGPESSL